MKIVLWKPTYELRKQIKKLNPDEYQIINMVYEAIALDLQNNDFDVILIEDEGYKASRQDLKDMGVDENKIYTFREFWVRNCEFEISEYYHQKWKKKSECGIEDFKDKVVVITGGASGIGYETAKAFYYAGAKVVITGRDNDKLEKAVGEIGSDRVKKIVWDITDIKSIDEKLIDIEKLYDDKISVFVNSAAMDSISSYDNVTENEYDAIVDTDMRAVYFVIKAICEYYKENYIRGHIVNVISVLAEIPAIRPYSVAKTGLMAATEGIGLKMAEYGITINGVSPGGVATPMVNWKKGDCPARRASRIGRVIFPCEVAEIILVLASKCGECMPGGIIRYDGGEKYFMAMHDW